jgi:hypothetical protein
LIVRPLIGSFLQRLPTYAASTRMFHGKSTSTPADH